MRASIGRVLPVALLFVVWELLTQARVVDPSFLPTVSSIVAAVWALLRGGEISENLGISLFRTFAGLGLATAVGIVLGTAMAVSRPLAGFFGPLVAVTYSL